MSFKDYDEKAIVLQWADATRNKFCAITASTCFALLSEKKITQHENFFLTKFYEGPHSAGVELVKH